jgi:transposase
LICRVVLADRAYDTNPVRQPIEAQQAAPKIPSKITQKWRSCFSSYLYKGRNAIERMLCRLKDFRRLSTRYDRLAANFLASVHLAAALTWWL